MITEKDYAGFNKVVTLYTLQLQMKDLMKSPDTDDLCSAARRFDRMIFHELFIKLQTLCLVTEKKEVFNIMKNRLTNMRRPTFSGDAFTGTYMLDDNIPLLDYNEENLTFSRR